MPIPSQKTAYLILIEPEVFSVFQIHFNAPPCSDRQNDRLQTGLRWGKDEVGGLFVGSIQATADHQEVAFVNDGAMDLWHDGPIKDPLALVPGSSRVVATARFHLAGGTRCLLRHRCDIPGWCPHRRFHCQGQPVRRKSPVLPASVANHRCAHTRYRQPPNESATRPRSLVEPDIGPTPVWCESGRYRECEPRAGEPGHRTTLLGRTRQHR